MPYTINNPPDEIKNLPKGAQRIWVAAFNSSYDDDGDDDKARKIAWAAVKKKYIKGDDGKWIRKAEDVDMPTTTEDTKKFAYRDPKRPETVWLPITTDDGELSMEVVAKSAALFDSGQVEIPEDEKPEVRKRLQEALRDLGVLPGDYPGSLRDTPDEKRARLVEKPISSEWTIVEGPTKGKLCRVRGIASVAEVVNLNHRLYPENVWEGAVKDIRKRIRTEAFLGEADHPSLWDGPTVKNTALRFTEVWMEGKNVMFEADVLPTRAGHDVHALIQSNIPLDISTRGWGSTKEIVDDDKRFLYLEVLDDFICDGFDVVIDGSCPHAQVTHVAERVGAKTMPTAKEEIVETSQATAVVEREDATAKALLAVAESLAATAKANTERDRKAEELVEKERKETARKEAVEKAIAGLDEKMKPYADNIRQNLETAETAEDVPARLKIVSEMLAQVIPIAEKGSGEFNIVRSKKDQAEQCILVGGKVYDRPETEHEVKQLLVQDLDNGARKWMNPKNVVGQILQNYEEVHPEYFRVLTRSGYQRYTEDVVTTAALSGGQLPFVLPLVREIFPALIALRLVNIWPMSRPTARVFYLRTWRTNDQGTRLNASGDFSYSWADYTECGTPGQVHLDLAYSDITAREKALQFSWKVEAAQDLRAYHNIDVQEELYESARNEILREINYEILNHMVNSATGGNWNYGTTLPASGFTTIPEWRAELLTYINWAASNIRSASMRKPKWVVCDPLTSARIQGINAFKPEASSLDDTGQYSFGVNLVGTLSSNFRVYECDWFTANVALLGYVGNSWLDGGYYYLPYIPLYVTGRIEAVDFSIAQAMLSRYARFYANPGQFGTVTVQPGVQGTPI